MRCCVPFCKNTSDHISTSEGDRKSIRFHGFPSESHLRAVWLKALGIQYNYLPNSAVVCSQHFLDDDIYETECGLRLIGTGAIPSTVQVCMICLDTDSKLILMSKHKLEEAYEKLTGHPLYDQGNLKQTLCVQCAQRLINFSRFRDKSLQARELMMELDEKYELITKQHIKMINRTKHKLKSNMVLTMLGPDHCDLHMLEHPSEDKQIKVEETEDSDDTMSVDIEMEVIHEYDNYVNDLVQDPLIKAKFIFQCTLCLEEFVYEHEYMQHICVHHQNVKGDGECDTSQVCKPHTAVSSSSSHCSLFTENKQADPSPSRHAADTSVAPLPASLVTNNDIKVLPTEEVDTNVSCRYKLVADCYVKLYDIFAKKVVQTPDGTGAMSCDSLTNMNTVSKNFRHQSTSRDEVPTTVIEPVTNSSRSLLVEHMNTHTEVKPTSRICEYKSKYQSQLTDRMRTHTGEKRYNCKICNKKYTQSSNLVVHMRTHTGEKPFTCKICNSKFTQNSRLVNHMKTHTGEKPYSCNICEHKFSSKGYLHYHMKIHSCEKLFTCKICNVKFLRNCYLVSHMRTHSGEKPYTCNICNSKFRHASSLVSHMRTHTGEKPFTCKICNSKFTQSSHLVRHMRTHTGEMPFTCKICNDKFTDPSSLVMHMRTHTGEKPFACKICNRQFTQSSPLVRHMRIHTGEKPYSCKICEYKFSSKNSLKDHMRTHTNEKPFTCTICNVKFAQNRYLLSHMRTHR